MCQALSGDLVTLAYVNMMICFVRGWHAFLLLIKFSALTFYLILSNNISRLYNALGVHFAWMARPIKIHNKADITEGAWEETVPPSPLPNWEICRYTRRSLSRTYCGLQVHFADILPQMPWRIPFLPTSAPPPTPYPIWHLTKKVSPFVAPPTGAHDRSTSCVESKGGLRKSPASSSFTLHVGLFVFHFQTRIFITARNK